MLLEVSLAMDEREGDEGNAEVGRGTERITREKPPEYVGMEGWIAISIEKYATCPELGKFS
jgi:hypothetical protein